MDWQSAVIRRYRRLHREEPVTVSYRGTETTELQNVGTCAQLPTFRRIKWDNPVPMPCDHFVTRGAGGYLGAHSHYCGADAMFVFLRGEEAVAFRCFHHKDETPQ